MILLGVISG